MAGYKPKHVA